MYCVFCFLYFLGRLLRGCEVWNRPRGPGRSGIHRPFLACVSLLKTEELISVNPRHQHSQTNRGGWQSWFLSCWKAIAHCIPTKCEWGMQCWTTTGHYWQREYRCVCWRQVLIWASSHPWTGHTGAVHRALLPEARTGIARLMNSSCTPSCAVAQGCNQIVCTLKEDWSFHVGEWLGMLYQIGTSGWGQTVSQGDAISSGAYRLSCYSAFANPKICVGENSVGICLPQLGSFLWWYMIYWQHHYLEDTQTVLQ